MPTNNKNQAKCWECGLILPENTYPCSCGHEPDLFERIGFDKEICPECQANYRNSICLNGCHLSKKTLDKFNKIFSGIKYNTE